MNKVKLLLLAGMLLSGATASQADIILDRLNKDAAAPPERIYNELFLKYAPGYGTDPMNNDGYLGLSTSVSPNGLKYSAGDGYKFDSLEFSFVETGNGAIQIFDAQETPVPYTQTLVTGGFWSWYTITADSTGYDFREVFIKVYSDAAEWAGIGTVELDRQVVPEPVSLCLLGMGGAALLFRRRRTA